MVLLYLCFALTLALPSMSFVRMVCLYHSMHNRTVCYWNALSIMNVFVCDRPFSLHSLTEPERGASERVHGCVGVYVCLYVLGKLLQTRANVLCDRVVSEHPAASSRTKLFPNETLSKQFTTKTHSIRIAINIQAASNADTTARECFLNCRKNRERTQWLNLIRYLVLLCTPILVSGFFSVFQPYFSWFCF